MTRAEREMLPFGHRQSDPSHGQDAPELAVREERDVSVYGAKMCDEPIGTVGNLRGHFTMRTAVPKDIPAQSLLANVDGALSFVIAIVPLCQVRLDLGRRPQPGQFTRASRALPRAGQHTGKLDVPKAFSKRARLVLAARGQWNVRAAGVLAGKRPLGSAVSDEVKPQKRTCCRAHGLSIAASYSPRRAARLHLAR
jgi:hypothetical protein